MSGFCRQRWRTAACVMFSVAVMLCGVDAANAQYRATVPPFGVQPTGYAAFTLDAGLDDLTQDANDRRRLLVEVWFPALESGSVRKPWASDTVGAALSKGFPLPSGFHADIATNSWLDAAPDRAMHPAIVFSHGLSFSTTLYQSFFEDLASRGYVVFAISHPHGALIIEYPDGTSLDMSGWPQVEDGDERERLLAETADLWASDLSAVLDAISSGQLPIETKVDGSRIGLFGHSLGGTAVGKLSRDERVAGIVVMEGDVRNVEAKNTRGSLQVAAPLLHLIGEYNRLELERASYVPGPEAPVFTAVIRGTGHAYFSDLIHLYRAYADRSWIERH